MLFRLQDLNSVALSNNIIILYRIALIVIAILIVIDYKFYRLMTVNRFFFYKASKIVLAHIAF